MSVAAESRTNCTTGFAPLQKFSSACALLLLLVVVVSQLAKLAVLRTFPFAFYYMPLQQHCVYK
jgi:hypothetical protein